MLHVLVNDDVKGQAAQTLTALGLSMWNAVHLFLRRVAIDQRFPLELRVPNVQSRCHG
jgi:DNA-damage-inducible protein J